MPNISKWKPVSPAVKEVISQHKKLVRELEKKGLGVEQIADYLKQQLKCTKPVFLKGVERVDIPDNANINRALETLIRVGDYLPSTKHEIEDNRNINIHITTKSADRAVKAANMEVIDCDEWEDNEFLK